MTRVRSVAVVLAVCVLTPLGAQAQVSPDVADGRRQALAGNFDTARATLEDALRRSDLSRADLVTIYEAQVFVDFATGTTDAMRDGLERIAALDPDHSFDASFFPAEVTDAFRDIVAERAGPLAVESDALVLASGEFEVRAEVTNDPGLSRSVQVHGRGAGGEWVSGSSPLRVDPDGASTGEYYVVAVGPGGAVLARSGQEASPLSVDLGVATLDEGGGGVPVWVWIVGGVVLAGIAATIIAVAVTSGGVSDDTQPTGPMVRF